MPRQKKVREYSDVYEMMIDELNNMKSVKNNEINGFQQKSNGLWVNDLGYVTNSIESVCIIGKLDEEDCFQYLTRRDCEYCKTRGLQYDKNV